MGGSLARQLKAQADPPLIRAWSQDEDDLAAGSRSGALDEVVAAADEVPEGCDLLVYATPLGATLRLLQDHAEVWAEGTTVTDLVSLKAPLMDRMRAQGQAHRYVGSHPMAGGEGAGFLASRAGLFQDARVWLVASEASDEVRGRVQALWEGLGARPAWTDARGHDEAMAWVSHLPQLVSNALALALEGEGFGPGDLGTGGLDMIRLANSSPEMWGDLLFATSNLPDALRALKETVGDVEALVRSRDLSGIVERMNRTRRWSTET
jgi:prephenate dehydrogenase